MIVKYTHIKETDGTRHSFTVGEGGIECIAIDDEEIRIRGQIGYIVFQKRNLVKYTWEHKGVDPDGSC